MAPDQHVYITKEVYASMMEFAQKTPNREILGVLFGVAIPDRGLEIKVAHPFRVGSRTDVEFEDEDYERLYPLLKQHEANGLEWVGWFHSHPFHGGDHIYMSKKDVRYHANVQRSNPNWTAIVINPHQIEDQATFHGMRAFRVNIPLKKSFKRVSVEELVIAFS